MGCEAEEIITNCDPLQKQWAKESGLRIIQPAHDGIFSVVQQLLQGMLRMLCSKIRRISGSHNSMFYRAVKAFEKRFNFWQQQLCLPEILAAQIKKIQPDVIYIQELNIVDDDFMKELKKYTRLLVGQVATRLPQDRKFDSYDLIISSLPNLVEYFRKMGIASECLKLAFEPRVLSRFRSPPQICRDIIHIGGYEEIHQERNALLETLSKHLNIEFWGYGVDYLNPNSPIRRNYCGEAWGLEMYNVRRNSRITLTKHITSVADRYANNATLFEATGVGTCLVTDMKDNLNELFEPCKDIIAYTCAEDCVEKVRYLLEHEEERVAIARAGQKRTLQEHTWLQRMQELVEILKKYI